MVSQPAALHLTHANASRTEKEHSGGAFSLSVLVSLCGSLPIPLSSYLAISPLTFPLSHLAFHPLLFATHFPPSPPFPLFLPSPSNSSLPPSPSHSLFLSLCSLPVVLLRGICCCREKGMSAWISTLPQRENTHIHTHKHTHSDPQTQEASGQKYAAFLSHTHTFYHSQTQTWR